MRYTLLEMTQLMLAALDSDEVNSITDTVESNQVAQLLRGVYYDLATELELPVHSGLFQLTPSGDAAIPCIMSLPTRVIRLDWVKYDRRLAEDTYPDFVEVEQVSWEDFLVLSYSLRELTSDVADMTVTSDYSDDEFTIIVRTDSFPERWVALNNRQLIFDAYDSEQDTTLQASKTMCHGQMYPEFTLQDSFEPELDPTQFAYFLNRAKVRAFAELKQVQNSEAASEARNQKIIIQKRARRLPRQKEVFRNPRYGR